MAAEPTPTRRPPDSATKLATSSLEIMTLLGPYQADVSAVEIPAASRAATVSATVGTASRSDFVQRRNESNIGSPECLAVGCCIQASIMWVSPMRLCGRRLGSVPGSRGFFGRLCANPLQPCRRRV